MSIRPPFTVPPEQLDKWDEDFENGYSEWKSNDIYSKSSKEDYRQFVIHLNTEFDVEEIYDKLEDGLAALEKLVTCTQRFGKFILEEDLDAVYSREKDAIYKEFIKCGFNFVKEYQTDAGNKLEEILESADLKVEQSQLSQLTKKKKKRNKRRQCPTEPGGHGQHTSDDIHTKAEVCQPGAGGHPASDPPNRAQFREEDTINHNAEEKLEVMDTPADDIKKEATDSVHLSQVVNNNYNDDSKMEETVSNHLSQVDSLEMTHNYSTPVEEQEVKNLSETKKKKRRNKDRRQKRLLKFHEKLVRTQGLPPSRLMVRKRLSSEFEQLAAGSPPSPTTPVLSVQMPGQTGEHPGGQPLQQAAAVLGAGYHHVPPPPPAPPDYQQLQTPQNSQSFGHMTGISSGSNPNFTLSSSPQSFLGSTSGPVWWPEARPVMRNSRWEGMTLLQSGLQSGSTSGHLNSLALSPSPQSSIGFVSPYHQTPPQPPSPSGSPAYCFHCMQYGAVFTINQV